MISLFSSVIWTYFKKEFTKLIYSIYNFIVYSISCAFIYIHLFYSCMQCSWWSIRQTKTFLTIKRSLSMTWLLLFNYDTNTPCNDMSLSKTPRYRLWVLLAGGIEVTVCPQKEAVRVRARDRVRPYVFVSAERGGDAATCCLCHLFDHWPTTWLGWLGGGCLTHTGCPHTVWAATVGSWLGLNGGGLCVLHACMCVTGRF